MRLAALVVTLALGSILGNGTAKAFDCTGATLASSIVICSDPELMRLTDERQEAIKEARGRIGEEAWPDLWETKRLGFDPTLRPAASNKIGRHQCRFRRQSGVLQTCRRSANCLHSRVWFGHRLPCTGNPGDRTRFRL